MALACQEVPPWTLGVIVGAFLDLALAYFLLCVSAFVCKDRGVQELVKSKFPFDVVWSKDTRSNLNLKLIRDVNCENGVPEFESEAYSSAYSSPKLQNLVDRESGYDAKGKRIMVLKKRPGIRRSRRAAPEYGKLPSPLSNDSSRSAARIFPFPCDDIDTRETSGESSVAVAGREDGSQDDAKAPTGDNMEECQASKLSGPAGESKGVDMKEKAPIVGNEMDTIRILQEALQKERASCAALYLELEKERGAAATAADEAMAMISRLQKDKASIEMEVRQYQRMIEEKFVYDEEEMDVLKEILLRREKENHFLEKEVEAYRQMSFSGKEQCNGDLSDMLRELGQKPSPSFNTDPLMMLQQTDDTIYNCKKFGDIADSTSEYEASFVEKQIHHNGYGSIEKCVISAGEEKVHTDDVMYQGMTTQASQENIDIEKTLYSDDEEQQQRGNLESSLHSSMLDTEPAVYDVHVIDGKTELWKEERFDPTFGASASSELVQAFPSSSQVDTEPKINTSSLEMRCGLPMLDNSQCKTLVIDSTKSSLPAVNSERLKIDTEVELLMERLQMPEERKEKLASSSSSEHGERKKSPQSFWRRSGLRFARITAKRS
ncbi:uncharacterized protein Pyn_01345 [Prunus yedoensis var. nudiflora]|uniref:GTD-binding domain-containing protein n=1 Tax=Prunus yedoensis var. nudiflora TaxID=2094558 RepID=A0A315A1S4_PRUYE|nr:uncharacterized protein Pyn_01345 [Prunus yedoensis var. nudiflora]